MSGVNFCLLFVIVALIPPIIANEIAVSEDTPQEAVAVCILIFWGLATASLAWWMVFQFLVWWL